MKRKQNIPCIFLLLSVAGSSFSLPLRATGVDWYGKISMGDNRTPVNASVNLKSNGELYATDQTLLDITGNYSGEDGAKAYLSAHAFINLSGTAAGSTEIIPSLSGNWDGSGIDLIRAKKEGSDVNAFHIKEVRAECEGYTACLQHREEGQELVWYLYGAKTLPLIKQLGNHTLLANNNHETNGGYNFIHYYWYKNGQLLKEGSHQEYGGSYYTGGANLEPGAEYTLEAIDTEGKRYYSCPYHCTPQQSPEIKAYPNPVSRNTAVYVEIGNGDEALLKDGIVEVYDCAGQYYGKLRVAGRRTVPVDLPAISGGYILKFKSGAVEREIKVIVK